MQKRDHARHARHARLSSEHKQVELTYSIILILDGFIKIPIPKRLK